MPLNLPTGTSCFIDGNIFYYHYVQTPGLSDECTGLLRRVFRREVRAATTTHVLAEAVHKVMLAEAAATFGLSRTGLATWLQRNPDRIRLLSEFRNAALGLSGLGVTVFDIDVATLQAATEVSQAEGLMTNDAIVVAAMRSRGLTHLATNDGDFDRVVGLTVWKPR